MTLGETFIAILLVLYMFFGFIIWLNKTPNLPRQGEKLTPYDTKPVRFLLVTFFCGPGAWFCYFIHCTVRSVGIVYEKTGEKIGRWISR